MVLYVRIRHLDGFVAILSTYYTVMENCCLYLRIGNSSRYRDIRHRRDFLGREIKSPSRVPGVTVLSRK